MYTGSTYPEIMLINRAKIIRSQHLLQERLLRLPYIDEIHIAEGLNYRLMGSGLLSKVKIGRSTRISEDDHNGYLDNTN